MRGVKALWQREGQKGPMRNRPDEELAYVKKYDTRTFEPGEVVYIVSTAWINEWKTFVQQQTTLPGPIDNSALIDHRGDALRGMEKGRHYRGVNGRIWSFWHSTYGGGPEIVRKSVDIYSEKAIGSASMHTAESHLSRPPPTRPHRDSSVPALPSRAPSDNASVSSLTRRAQPGRTADGRVDARELDYPPERPGRTDTRASAAARAQSYGRVTGGQQAAAPRQQKGRLVCDACDGDHETDRCPHFRGKPRDKHPSAWENYGKKNKGDGAEQEVLLTPSQATVVQQPGDGSCLYHSLTYHLGNTSAQTLRREIADFVKANPSKKIASTELAEWIKYDTGQTASSYASKMAVGSNWGGGIEMAACSHMHNVDVHVYQRSRHGFSRISVFNAPKQPPRKTITVCYEGGCHYNALVVRGG